LGSVAFTPAGSICPRIMGKMETGLDGFGTALTMFLGMPMPIDQTDYSVVVKLRAPPPNSWKWEIYRAGRSSPIGQASVYFRTMAAASSAGKEALKQLLDKLHSQPQRSPAE
jgi:hypothetical protein